jgi:spore protease
MTPSVLGITGIESYDIIKGVVDRTRPSCIVAVDSLASAAAGRLATAFQVSDAGITPGSGVGNRRLTLDKSSLGCPVYSIGVPLVVFVTTIVEEIFDARECERAQTKLRDIADLIVTPKDIDILVAECAQIIALALNMAVHTGLSEAELMLK